MYIAFHFGANDYTVVIKTRAKQTKSRFSILSLCANHISVGRVIQCFNKNYTEKHPWLCYFIFRFFKSEIDVFICNS